MIVLFDLDGTVLTFAGGAPGPGRTAMGRASRELFGRDHTEGVRFAGGTDRAIARTLLTRAGLPFEEARVTELLDRYLEHLVVALAERAYQPIGDVAAAVEACVARGACVGIATGNVRRGAHIKLTSAGLGAVFSLERGGYGCDHELRAEVVRAGIRRCDGPLAGDVVAEAPSPSRPVVVVGDTRHDVEAARAVGAYAVGVAVNAATRAELVDAGADAIVDRCGPELVEAIFTVCR